jgi:hypothetical protein
LEDINGAEEEHFSSTEDKPMNTRPAVAVIGLLFVILGALAPLQSIAAEKSLVGSWIIDVIPDDPGSPPGRNIGTITSDRTMIITDPEFGTGHGIWKKTGAREFSVRFLALVPTGHPVGEGTITVTSPVTVDNDGDTARGPFTTVMDAANLQQTVTGTVVLTRIEFDR